MAGQCKGEKRLQVAMSMEKRLSTADAPAKLLHAEAEGPCCSNGQAEALQRLCQKHRAVFDRPACWTRGVSRKPTEPE